EYYRAADLCLVPSHHESFGMAALEAMACGATVVASRVGGLATTIQDGVTGVLVPPRDEVALASAIGSLLADGPRRRTLGRHAAHSHRGPRGRIRAGPDRRRPREATRRRTVPLGRLESVGLRLLGSGSLRVRSGRGRTATQRRPAVPARNARRARGPRAG